MCKEPSSLQWGRNFIVAETMIIITEMILSIVLQWGRNFIVAETAKKKNLFGLDF